MQTFVTASDYGVENLDNKRLNKQLLECRQILNILITLRKDPAAKVAWRNHPAVKMWAGCEFELFKYCIKLVLEMHKRDIAFTKNLDAINRLIDSVEWTQEEVYRKPSWVTDAIEFDRIITTHRASLYKKDPIHYAEWKFESDWVDKYRSAAVCCDRCNYYWPTHLEA